MEMALVNKLFFGKTKGKEAATQRQQNLTRAEVNRPYAIRGIETAEKDMQDFLFTLGCFEGEKVTVISTLADNYIIHVKDARYSIDADLAEAILI